MSNDPAPTLFRLRVAYPKLGRLKYLGHLEVIHTIEQVVRRARLPYAVTQGFSPHMRIAYASALPVGTSSTAEYFDVYLTELVPASEALERLQDAAPADLRPIEAGYVELRRPALTAEITRVDYLVELTFAEGADASQARLDEMFRSWWLAEEELKIPYRRGKKTKQLDLKRVLLQANFLPSPAGKGWVELRTLCDNNGSLRPEIVVAAFDQGLRGLAPGVDEEIVSTGIQQLKAIAGYQVERCGQRIALENGEEVEPLAHRLKAPKGSLSSAYRDAALSNL